MVPKGREKSIYLSYYSMTGYQLSLKLCTILNMLMYYIDIGQIFNCVFL